MRNPESDTSLRNLLETTFHRVGELRSRETPVVEFREIGLITAVSQGVATVSGLPAIKFEEMVRFQNGTMGIAFHIEEKHIGCIVLGESAQLSVGMEVERLNRVMDVPVGQGLLGRVIDPTGQPLDTLGRLDFSERRPVESPAPAIMDRLPVTIPLQTGIKVIDALIPIGRGQRQLIVGDRQTGKTSIALAAMTNQHDTNVICIYCAVGQRGSSVAKLIEDLREKDSLKNAIVVVAGCESGPGLQYISPYAATAMGEYFMGLGRDVLIVYDDLGSHARAYRELSLLLRRPPGREAFPGDIFYIHSRLLERATHLRPELGGGSLTALPIVETEAQNLAGYIPTNLISITDGQIYLSPTLFQKGMLPAVDVGKSVSRVGGKTQLPAYQAVSSELKLFYSQFEELEMFSRFGTRLDEHTRKIIGHGRRIRHILKQSASDLFHVFEQIVVLLALTNGLFDAIPEEMMPAAEKAVRKTVETMSVALRSDILARKPLSVSDREGILKSAGRALEDLSKRS
ncbi:MAG: alternate F1F0 ATPase, F1 subunit alpha [Candidatus Ozemobacteraceae bacterium]